MCYLFSLQIDSVVCISIRYIFGNVEIEYSTVEAFIWKVETSHRNNGQNLLLDDLSR